MGVRVHIAIVGSRRRVDKEKVFQLVDNLPYDAIVISGGCKGIDSWAVKRAAERNLEVKVFKPNLAEVESRIEATKRYYARNKQIAEAADIIHAFVASDRTGGTENTIKYAREFEKKIVIHEEESINPENPQLLLF